MLVFLNTLTVKIECLQPEKLTLTQFTIMSSLVVSGIVFMSLLSHNMNMYILDDPIGSIIMRFFLAGIGFLLELGIIYRERNQ